MATTSTETAPNQTAAGVKRFLKGLTFLWLSSIVIYGILQTRYFDPSSSAPEPAKNATTPSVKPDNSIKYAVVLSPYAVAAVLLWIIALYECFQGLSKAEDERSTMCGVRVFAASLILSSVGLLAVGLATETEFGIRGWVSWMGLPVVGSVTIFGLLFVIFPLTVLGSEEARVLAVPTKQDEMVKLRNRLGGQNISLVQWKNDLKVKGFVEKHEVLQTELGSLQSEVDAMQNEVQAMRNELLAIQSALASGEILKREQYDEESKESEESE